MDKESRVNFAVIVCTILMFLGLIFILLLKNVEPNFHPVLLGCLAVSGFAAAIRWLLLEDINHFDVFVGLAGTGILISSITELLPK